MMFYFPFQHPSSMQFTFLSSIPVANGVYLCNWGRQMCARGLCSAMKDRLGQPYMREFSPPAFMVGAEKPKGSKERWFISVRRWEWRQRRVGIKFPTNLGLPSAGRFSEELSFH